MKTSVFTTLLFAGIVTLVPTHDALAFQDVNDVCTNCHMTDTRLTLTVTESPVCSDGQKQLNLSVSGSGGMFPGWAVFDAGTNITNGPGTAASFLVPAGRTYQIWAGYSINYGVNSVQVSPSCSPTGCVDGDGDLFSVTGGSCGVLDCNDDNAAINPGAAEVKLDGIDQDCNGYDLTITVVKAAYTAKRTSLTVQATSAFGAGANLSVDGFGAMSYQKRTGLWSLTVSTSPKPASVTVRGFEGTETVAIP